ncbi:MAG TPA: hypothetical protein VFR41_06025, partial [Acidimicrobiia bacterium]|nr:hypothetical protein [Acidimicrobiia bacterium]
MAFTAAALVAFVLGGSSRAIDPQHHVPWFVIAAGFVLAETCALHLRFRGNTQTFTPDEILIVIGLFVLSPSHLVVAYLVGGTIALGVIRRIRAFKLFFNLCQWALSSTVAVVVLHALAGSGPALEPRNWLAAIAATSVAALVSMVSITVAVTILEGRPALAEVARSTGFGLLGTIINTMLGLGALVMLSVSPYALVLLAGPVAIVLLAYRSFVRESSKSRGLEFLYAASGILNGAEEFETGLLELLDFSRETFHAELAEVVLLGDDGAAAYRTSYGPGDSSRALAAADSDVVREIFGLALTKPGAVLFRPTPGGPLALRDGVALGSVLVAQLRDESGMLGALFVARANDAVLEVFDKEEFRLFQIFANHLGTTIEKSRLSTSLAQLRALEQKLAHQAYHDALTGLANRVLFHDRINDALARATEGDGMVAVLFI